METVNGEWIMHGVRAEDPECIHTVQELEQLIDDIGFLPLFGNEIPGFSVEERTVSEDWWSDDEGRDPWMWRTIIARNGQIAYGKFFNRKAGFISKKWFPYFANDRRDGYDFDARWDDELASLRSKKIMDLFAEEKADRELFSFEMKEEAGFGKNGEKNFDGTLTELEMQTYLLVRDFRQRINKAGKGYGWHVAVYCTPEHLWGYDYVTSQYCEEPDSSSEKIVNRIKEVFPEAAPEDIRKVLGVRAIEKTSLKRRKVTPFPDNLIKALRLDLDPDKMTDDQKAGLTVAIGQLRDKHQKIIKLKYKDHLTNEAIGVLMNRSAGTISSTTTKALKKLRWPEIRIWYVEGYHKVLNSELERMKVSHWISNDSFMGRNPDEELCLVIGLNEKQFRSFLLCNVVTVGDLRRCIKREEWYKPISGVGAISAARIEEKLREYLFDHLLIVADRQSEVDMDAVPNHPK